MALPETDLHRIRLWALQCVPEHLWDQLKVEADPIARLRYTKSTGRWAIHWRDRNVKFHEYERKRPTKNVQGLLDHIGTSGDPIFWG